MSAVSVSEPDVRPVLAEAADLARRALLELEPSAVGAHLGVSVEDETAATHRFEATLPGYRGWQWAVVVAAPPGADRATVSESALLPGSDALVAPEFVPWEQRIRPGDLAPGDLLAPPHDDPRLVPGYMASGDPEVDDVALEIGLGRTKVLSEEGRIEAAERWYSEYGPDTEMAKAAPSTCGKCGFYLPLAGALRAAFGVCGNAMGADGHVVHVEYGCGAHSDVVAPTGGGSPLYEAYDDAAFDVIPPEELRKGAERSAAEEVAGDGVSAAVETTDASVPAGEASADGAASVVETAAVTEEGAVRAEIAPSEPEAVAAEAGAGELAPSADAGEPGVDTADAVQAEATGTEAALAETASTATELSTDDAVASGAADAAVSDGEQAAVEGESVSGAAGIEQAETDEVAAAPASDALEALKPSTAEPVTDAAQPSASGDTAAIADAAEGETEVAASDVAAEPGSATDAGPEPGSSAGPESGSSPRN
ncbi:DUF3027 domain-containing protein [Nocardia amikacinitolerans]|uniref:DUF3027 domain-containing protein n=1 Tax=Nocardia amikacinitolerans TaxID=756689 RepID=UPI0020A379F1|nr:DUF3027 domain-containing protein [Nocardia amikacinitolerans]MCP2291772.1 Protein of unknown function (DUF3027) [Nocardia amikacinitolerans]